MYYINELPSYIYIYVSFKDGVKLTMFQNLLQQLQQAVLCSAEQVWVLCWGYAVDKVWRWVSQVYKLLDNEPSCTYITESQRHGFSRG